MSRATFNHEAAELFRRCAEVLQQQSANPFRINAYLRGAETLDAHDDDVRSLLDEQGLEGLIALPGIGQGLASAIEEFARTGRLAQLDRLQGETTPETLFQSVPGIGPKLAHAIHDALDIDTLEALEQAAHDGRLAAVPGIGERRNAAIQASLAAQLGRHRAERSPPATAPPVSVLLDVDRDYRQRAAAGKLQKIAPRRFNPEGRAWLPILHTDRGPWHFTALFSNTARAHELGRTNDWVVLYFYDGNHQEGQCTAVTETHGPLAGQRVVRGREAECRALAEQKAKQKS